MFFTLGNKKRMSISKIQGMFTVIVLSFTIASAAEISVLQKHAKKAQDAMHARDFSTALVEWRKAKGSITGTQGVTPRLWFEMGRCHRALREHSKAIDCFKKAVVAHSFTEQSSYIWRSKLNMALSLHDLGQRKEAQDLLRLCEAELDALRDDDILTERRKALQTTHKIIRNAPQTNK